MMGARDWLCDSPGPLASEPWAACLGLGLHRGLEGPRRARQRPREEGHLAAALGLDAPYAVPQRAWHGARRGSVSVATLA